jgi:hypothetical protein
VTSSPRGWGMFGWEGIWEVGAGQTSVSIILFNHNNFGSELNWLGSLTQKLHVSLEFLNKISGNDFSRGEDNSAKIYFQYLNQLSRLLASIVFSCLTEEAYLGYLIL